MLSVNHIIIVGTIQGAPTTTKRRASIETRLVLANRSEEGIADIIDVVTHGDLAISAGRLRGGSVAYIEGRLRSRTVALPHGISHRTYEIVADSVQTI